MDKKILIGTPIFYRKAYSIPKWLECVEKTGLDLLMVDNSPEPMQLPPLKENWKVNWIGSIGEGEDFYNANLARSREIIRLEVLKNYDYWLSWECDILFDQSMIDKLLYLIEKADLVHHRYPARFTNKEQGGIGCSLISRKVLEHFTWLDHKPWGGADGWLLNWLIEQNFKIIDFRDITEITHLANEAEGNLD